MGKFLKIGFFFLLGIALIWWSLHQIPAEEWTKFTLALKQSKLWIVFPVFIILGLSHFLRALRWRLIMEPLGYQPSIANTYFAVLIGYLANLAIPRLGEVLKCTILAKYEKVPAEKIVGTIVAERAFDVLSLGIVFLMALGLQFNVIEAGWNQLKNQTATPLINSNEGNWKIYLYVGIGVILLALFFILRKRIPTIVASIKQILSGIWEGVMSATKLKQHNLLASNSEKGILFWSAMYIPVVIAMSATQNVKAALSGGWVAVFVGIIGTGISFLCIPLIVKMGKKIIAAKNILKGAIVLESDLAYKSPGDGISPAQSEAIIGRTALREIVAGESLRLSDVN